jgi:hypothetical protein
VTVPTAAHRRRQATEFQSFPFVTGGEMSHLFSLPRPIRFAQVFIDISVYTYLILCYTKCFQLPANCIHTLHTKYIYFQNSGVLKRWSYKARYLRDLRFPLPCKRGFRCSAMLRCLLLEFRDNLLVLPLKMGPLCCSETSITDYQSKLLNVPEERRSRTILFCV